jgi:hypothetical protein
VKLPSTAENAFVSNNTLLAKVLVVATLPSLVKSPTFGDVTFRVKGQSAILGKVTLHGKVVILDDIAFLSKVPTVIITSILLVSLPVFLASLPLSHVHHRQHRAGIFDLLVMAPLSSLRWRHPPCSNWACPITTPLAIRCNMMRCQLPFQHIAFLGKFTHCCDVALLGELAFLGEVTILGKVANLGKLARLATWLS